jgi:hypothetical protein
MKTTVLVCLTLFVFTLSSTTLAERTDTREHSWERPADQTASGISGIGDAVGPGDDLIPVSGTEGNDEIIGGSGDEHIRGLGGDDTIYGQGGSDLLDGGIGEDVILGGNDNDHVRGGLGNDILLGGMGNDRLVGGPGRDNVTGGVGNDLVYGGVGMDVGHYFIEANVLSSDYYDGGPGADLITLHVPPGFDMGTATDIEMQFLMSAGYMDLNPWGIALVLVNFEDMTIQFEPDARGNGDSQPLATQETTWGALKALYR